MELNRKISKSGSITIPANLRRDLGIEKGEKFNLEVQADGRISLKRIVGSCVFCKSDEKVVTYSGRFICGKCLSELKKL